jgi:histidinol-phosphatase
MPDRRRHLEVALAAARAGGEVSRRYFQSGVEVERKSDRSPVTVADRESEQRIVAVLRQAFPGYGVLGEEFGERAGAGARWIVDPIDGTKSFVRGIPYFAVLIGLEEEGEITVGVVHEPISGDTYHASRGEGAFGPRGRLRVSDIATLGEGMIVFGGLQAWRKAARWDALERLVAASGRQRGYGDYLGHVFVAAGLGEAMVELELKPWDMAPLKILVEEAGGRLTDLQGRATIHGGSCVTSNGRVHAEVLELIGGTRK